MSLADRIARLEAKLKPSAPVIPVFIIALESGKPSKPYSIEHDGETWTQEPGESLEAFKERAKAGALLHPAPKGKFPAIWLCATRPSLTKEQWLERHGAGGSENWPGESN